MPAREQDRAFEMLQAYEERAERLVYVNVDPQFDGLRQDKRFDEPLQQIGLAH